MAFPFENPLDISFINETDFRFGDGIVSAMLLFLYISVTMIHWHTCGGIH